MAKAGGRIERPLSIERRVRRLEGERPDLVFAEMLAAWAKKEREAGDPGGVIAQANAELRQWERERGLAHG